MGFLGRLFGGGGPALAHEDIEAGMVFDTKGGSCKVIKVEAEGVHIIDVGSREPVAVDGMEISMGGMHMPLSRGAWAASKPKLVRTEPVEPHELEGYEHWREAGGGWF